MQFSAIHLFKIILHIYAISRQISYNNSNRQTAHFRMKEQIQDIGDSKYYKLWIM